MAVAVRAALDWRKARRVVISNLQFEPQSHREHREENPNGFLRVLCGYVVRLSDPFAFRFHCSSENPASAILPGPLEVIVSGPASTTAQSGSLGTWRALFR